MASSTRKSVSAVIPAYNEAATVGKVIETLKQVTDISEIIVVSDGSSDATAGVARRHGARVIELATNGGKGAAMAVGARAAREDILLFLDADLEGLTAAHVEALIAPLLDDSADMTVGIFSRGRSLTDLAQVVAPHLSGQRAIRKELFLAVGAEKSRFEIEVLLNGEARARGWRVKKVPLVNMTHVMKEEKRGLWRGFVARLGMYKDILVYLLRLTGKKIKTRPVLLVFWALILGTAFNYHFLTVRATAAEARMLPALELQDDAKRLLVISPHPDDETLGVGGLIAQARGRGDAVKVVFMTNGDGFRRGVEKFNGFLPAGPADFLQYGNLRQREALSALAVLGVKNEDVIFLGYPDGGLADLWLNFWAGDRPYTSPYTRQTRVAYKLAFSPGAPYTAASLLDNLVDILKEYRPTAIYVTDTGDSHPDHWATGAFTLAAVGRVEGEDPSFRPEVYTYIIHSGVWQMIPVVDRQEKPLLPPRYFLDGHTKWYKLTLSPRELELKKRAIAAYKSQVMVISTFMANFERPNEVFARVDNREIPHTYGVVTWSEENWVAIDPPGDQPVRKFEQGGDLKALYLSQEGNNLHLRLDTLGKPGFPVRYTISLYMINGEGPLRRFVLQVPAGGSKATWLIRPQEYDPVEVAVAYRQNGMEFTLTSLLRPGDRFLMLEAATYVGKIPLDRVPWRLLQVNGGTV